MRLHALVFLVAVPALTLAACTGDIKDGKPLDTDTGSILDTADTSAVVETVCDDGADDDGDGATDCDDADCASDAACPGTGECWDQDLGSATGTALATGTLEGATDDARSACGTDGSVDVLFKWKAPAAGLWRFSAAGSEIDTVVAVFNPDCSGQERLCVEGAVLERRLSADEEVLVMLEGVGGDVGNYTLGIVASSTTESDCADGTDGDLDGLTDCDDADCESTPQCLGEDDCTNGVDDDLDGLTDCDDSNCFSDPACLIEDCDNRRDDDRDGFVDCNDDECASLPVCIPEVDCTNGLDDEGDGTADCDDSDCLSEAACIGACTDADLGSAVGVAVATGDTTGMGDDRSPSTCSSSSAEDAAYSWTAPATGSWTFSTDGSDFDTVLTVEEGGCTGATEIACDDDGGTAPDSLVSLSLTAGDTVIINVDGYSANTGTFALNILADFETDCFDGADEDGDGAADCDDTDCDLSCPEDRCSDGMDEDADGATDCDDSDCVGTAVCLLESDCTDGLDDDADGYTDCDDPSCATDASCRAVDCLTDDLGSALGENILTLDTTGAGDDVTTTCGSTGIDDAQVQWTAPADGTYTFEAAEGTGLYPVLEVTNGDCASGTSLGCDYDFAGVAASVTTSALAGDILLVTVESIYGYDGTFDLSITSSAEVVCGDSADDDADGLVDCDDSDCAASCYEVICDDGVDGDADGALDCDDIDCVADAHCIPEPDCNDGTDEDTDGLVDCDDSDCAADFACTGDCFDGTLLSGLGADLATGISASDGDEHAASCASGTGGEDLTWLWTAPADDYFTFSTNGSDYHTVVSVDTAACTGATELGCDDDAGGPGASSVRVALTTGEQVLVTLDGASSADSGTYALGIFGDAEHACEDGADDDRDGTIDCDDTDCLSVPACGELDCADGTDGDTDGSLDCLDTDCDADAACFSALADYDLGGAIGTGVATGSNTSATATLAASCVSTGGRDVIYRWVAPSTDTWTFDLTGSSYDTSLTINDLSGSELTCDDDSGTGTTSMLTWSLNEGEAVLVVVSAYSSASTGTYTLAIY